MLINFIQDPIVANGFSIASLLDDNAEQSLKWRYRLQLNRITVDGRSTFDGYL